MRCVNNKIRHDFADEFSRLNKQKTKWLMYRVPFWAMMMHSKKKEINFHSAIIAGVIKRRALIFVKIKMIRKKQKAH